MDFENDEMLKQNFEKNSKNNKEFLNSYLKLLELEKSDNLDKKFFKTFLKELKVTLEKAKAINSNDKKRLSYISFKEIVNPIPDDDFDMEKFSNSFFSENFLEIKYEKICLKMIKKKLNKLFNNNFESISTIYYIIEAIKRFQEERNIRLNKYDNIMETYHKGINFTYTENILDGNLENIKNYSYYLGYEEINYMENTMKEK